MGKWRSRAREIIYQAYFEAKQLGLRGRSIRRFITQRYSLYGYPRKKFPYRVWLNEIDALMYRELNGASQVFLPLNFEAQNDTA